MEFWLDGTARLTVQKGKNQPDPATVALTETTARALPGVNGVRGAACSASIGDAC